MRTQVGAMNSQTQEPRRATDADADATAQAVRVKTDAWRLVVSDSMTVGRDGLECTEGQGGNGNRRVGILVDYLTEALQTCTWCLKYRREP